MKPSVPPYLRIAGEIGDRIARGELRPGDRVPSARLIMREWGVAMATASKVLTTLRHDGLVEVRPGVGTVVLTAGRATPAVRVPTEGTLTTARVVEAGIAVADADGLDALSMRQVAADLGAGVMSLYRHVANKDELIRHMIRAVFAERELPAPAPEGWRAKLELVSRVQWELYRRHPWLAAQVSMTRPMLLPEMMAHTEWVLAALEGLGLTRLEMTREAVALPAFVRGVALSVADEIEAERNTGLTSQQWWLSLRHEVEALYGRFPRLVLMEDDVAKDLDAVFAHGLARHLDGLGVAIRHRRNR
ncbi:transcriptional regulator, TetR family [Amycolatopsis marina]|uniref:Transcriptional regulator, TetR family n=1 Tax=Amycolatopsis marina TaxID=490629 RepID=A0A1I1BK47_9PSEU|nr:GntR family transcriptional regulator [Amycolatopsis marina]SFB49996.1 transcriptional regulator, TetR family [Amycolatopsis marina]